MAKAKMPSSARAPSAHAAAKAARVGNSTQKRGKKSRPAKGAGGRPAGGSGAAAVRPPTTPEDFSQNWKALQELLRQKLQAPEKPLVPQVRDKKQPDLTQRGRARGDGTPVEDRPTVTRNSVPSGPGRHQKGPLPPTGPRRASRTGGDVSAQRKDARDRKQKAEAAAPVPPTEEDIWFDDVDPEDIEAAMGPEAARIARSRLGLKESSVSLVKEQAFGGLTRALALDCEMVGVGPQGEESVAARVSIVNRYGKCVYDKFIKPAEPVTDYRTEVSGVRPEDLRNGEELGVVQKEVAAMLQGRILVGHALHNDLKVLFLDHPKKKIRDTQKYKPFKRQVKSLRPSLKLLAERILGLRVQQAEHCSIQDAQAAMRLYVSVRKEWESHARERGARGYTPGKCSNDT
ncbi:RNA exonuclease 4 isoform X2 [Ochotona curzoniae]|uniref:RNA exonuclease 4 isoform X2 n=1 Tax=Ochotona curzoniae TaxID=130825 RepID=UPI001B34BEDA|nr:RNA exonuclease 4 isoform X2 [Ochotona curzoniae]